MDALRVTEKNHCLFTNYQNLNPTIWDLRFQFLYCRLPKYYLVVLVIGFHRFCLLEFNMSFVKGFFDRLDLYYLEGLLYLLIKFRFDFSVIDFLVFPHSKLIEA